MTESECIKRTLIRFYYTGKVNSGRTIGGTIGRISFGVKLCFLQQKETIITSLPGWDASPLWACKNLQVKRGSAL